MSQVLQEGLRARKRRSTMARIASEASRLVLEQGMAGTTVDQIAEAAEVGRASFFRYFPTKERAVAEGFTGVWLRMIVRALEKQPDSLPPMDAVRAGFAELADGFEQQRALILSQAELSRSSSALSAWTLQVYLGYEEAIALVVAPRFGAPASSDPRPRLVGALTMASVRLALDDWVVAGGSGDLPALIRANLDAISIGTLETACRSRRSTEAR